MPNVAHVATIAAYPIKAELGGGFRGVMLNRETNERRISDRLNTLEEATYWAKVQAHATYDANGYSLAPVRKRGEYYANVWVSV